MYQEAGQLIRSLGFTYSPKEKMRNLSVSDMQIIEMIKALSKKAKVIIMDEPTSSITDRDTEVLFQQIEKLKEQGIAVIYITHKMDEIFRIGDTVSVLRDGELIRTSGLEGLTKDKIISLMVGRAMREIYPENPTKPGELVLELKGLTRTGIFQNINLTLRQGRNPGYRRADRSRPHGNFQSGFRVGSIQRRRNFFGGAGGSDPFSL